MINSPAVIGRTAENGLSVLVRSVSPAAEVFLSLEVAPGWVVGVGFVQGNGKAFQVAYLTDVMPRLVDGEGEDVSDLLPRQWKAARQAA